MYLKDGIATAVHIGADDLPFVNIDGDTKLKVIHVKPREGVWVGEFIFAAGYTSLTHRHLGPVWGFTHSGAWKYKEYDYVNRAGSFLYEQGGSVHTFECLEDNTRASFVVAGPQHDVNPDGTPGAISDPESVLQLYYSLCEAADLPKPKVLIG